MKKNILKLRILGMVTFLLFLLSCMFPGSSNPSFNFSQIQQALAFISFASFAIVMVFQIYRFYIKNIKTYVGDGEEEM
jgi:hypothetical protein